MSWLHGVVAAAGTLVALGAVVVAVNAFDLSVPSPGRLVAACRAWLTPQLRPVEVLVFALGALGATVLARAIRSVHRAQRSSRAFIRTLGPCGALLEPVSARVIEDAIPQAFCAGLLRPRIFISTGALDRLDDDELRAVLAHEAHHALRRDPLRLFLARVLADVLFFLPVMRPLQRRYATLAEMAADEAAIGASGNRSRWPPRCLRSASSMKRCSSACRPSGLTIY